MAGQGGALELRDYLKILWPRRWLIALTMAVASSAALGVSALLTPQYEATSKIFIGPRTAEKADLSTALEELTFSEEFVASYAEMLKSRTLAEHVVERLSLTMAPSDLVKKLKSRVLPDTRIIELSVTYPDAARASVIANTLAQTFVTVQQEFGGHAGVQATVFEPAVRPLEPASPRPLRNGMLGASLGLILGIAIAFLRSQLDTRIRTREDLQAVVPDLAVLAEIAPADSEDSELLFLKSDPQSRQAEAFRKLRTNIQFYFLDKPVFRLLVTSPHAGEGKTTVATNLSMALAAGGLKTILIDADLRRPTSHRYYGVEPRPGVTDVLVGHSSIEEALRWVSPYLGIIPAGALPPNPAELLGSYRVDEVLKRVSELADVVIFDAPPLLPVTDAAVLATQVDGVLLVLRSGQSTREHLRQSRDILERLRAHVIGTVLNEATSGEGQPSQYYYYYRYASSAGDERPPLPDGPTAAPSPRRGGSRVRSQADATVASDEGANGAQGDVLGGGTVDVRPTDAARSSAVVRIVHAAPTDSGAAPAEPVSVHSVPADDDEAAGDARAAVETTVPPGEHLPEDEDELLALAKRVDAGASWMEVTAPPPREEEAGKDGA